MSNSEADVLSGVVESFDPRTGAGTIKTTGGDEWPFHCVEIADGSRAIDVGVTVRFLVDFRTLRREAVSIVKA